MKLLLNGGGVAEPTTSKYYRPQTARIYGLLDGIIDNSKPILYVPWAKPAAQYSGGNEWIKDELACVRHAGVEMVETAAGLSSKNLSDYTCIYIGGGNQYKLLKEIKDGGAYGKIMEYLVGGGVVYGNSAGAIIFGKDIDSGLYGDPNEADLADTAGFDLLGGASVAAHYTNGTPDDTARAEKYLTEYSYREPVIAISEQSCIYIDDGDISVIGDADYYVFGSGACVKYGPDEKLNTKI